MAFDITIRPRISDTDMFGHINNVAVVAWFEEGRSYMARQIMLAREQLAAFIVARIEIDYLAQIYFGHETRISTAVERIGNSSVIIVQEIWQQEKCCARARCVIVHFDREAQRSIPLPDWLREGFTEFLAG